MILLVFAHKKEAIHFFDRHSFERIPVLGTGELYLGSINEQESALLITREGLWKTLENTILAINELSVRNKLPKVIYNLGVAGGLTPEVETSAIYQVRMILAQKDQSVEFQTYSCQVNSQIEIPIKDCLSAQDRVLNREYKNQLAPFAPIVDRELWSVARAANLFKIPLYALKVISDMAEGGEDVCHMVKERVRLWSSQLYDGLQCLLQESINIQSTLPSKFWENLPNIDNLYFTVSQKRQFEKLLKILGIQSFQELEKLLNEFESSNPTLLGALNKKKTGLFLNWLSSRAFPDKAILQNELKKILTPLATPFIHLNWEQDLSRKNIELKINLQNKRDAQELINALENIDWKKLDNLFAGNFNV